MPSEAQARLSINKLLEEAGWRLMPDGEGRRENVVCEHRVSGHVYSPNVDLGRDFEKAPDGFVDYVLLGEDGRALAVLEAKREEIDPLTAKEKARTYAEGLEVNHVFLSNGLVHYYWNLGLGNPVRVSRFLRREHLGETAEWRPDTARLAAVPVDENYIAVSQDSQWLSYTAEERGEVMVNRKIRLLRDYQIAAVKRLQAVASPTQHRFLFEMATGTGKTLLSAAIAKLYLRTGNATRILFLVDRLELETQAFKNFRSYLENDGIRTVIYKQKRTEWRQAQVVVTTIQSLAARNRFLHEFAPSDFQLIISDEAHRTISGNNRVIFEYFIGAKLGLTATPRDYLKGVNVEALREDDPAALERRLLLDSYRTFGCDDGQPTFRFSLLDAVQHQPPYLCNPVAMDARTDITTRMLSEQGIAFTMPADEDGHEQEIVFTRRDFERRFFSDETNRSFVRCFLDHAHRDPLTGEIGKTIFFAVTRRHATKLASLLNEEAAARWPKEYGSGSAFAVQVTSDIPGAQRMTIDFANNNLNGRSKWREEEFRGYETSRTRVCVTVGMMTTGYDCEDILNVALARPIFSPADFIQIKGRGTRLFTFRHGSREAPKAAFALFDFFANCEYFEEDFDYDEQLTLPKESADRPPSAEPGATADDFTSTSPDPMVKVSQDPIGPFGMRIDREMYRERFARQAQDAAASDEALREACEAENWPAVEARVRQLLFGKPDEFWDLQRLQELYKTDRLPGLREILARVFGLIPAIPTREELARQEFERYLASQPTNPSHSRELMTVFVAFLLDPRARTLLKAEQFPALRLHDPSLFASLQRLDPNERAQLIGYLAHTVDLEAFALAA